MDAGITMISLDWTRIRKLVATWATQIHFSQILAFFYMIIAAAIAYGVVKGSFGWLFAAHPITRDMAAAWFGVCGVILATKPSDRWFVVGLTPLAGFAGVVFYYTYFVAGSTSPTSLYYALSLIVLPLAYRFAGQGKIRLSHLYALIMVLYGLATISGNSGGSTASYITSVYGIPAIYIGIALLVGGFALVFIPTPSMFIYSVSLLLLYTVTTVLLTYRQSSVANLIIVGLLALIIFLTMTRPAAVEQKANREQEIQEMADALIEGKKAS